MQSPDSTQSKWWSGRQTFINALGIAQICSWGSLYYAFPLIAEQIERDTGWSRTVLYGAATAGLLLGAVAAYPIGKAIDRGRGRIIMAGGSVLAGLLLLALSQVAEIVGLYAVVGLLGAVQAATLYEAAFAVVARRVGPADARGGITSLTLWGGFASTVFIPIVQLMIDAWGWRGALIGLGVVNLTLCAGIYAAVVVPSRDKEQAAHNKHGKKLDAKFATRSPVFWLLAVAFTTHAAAFTAFTFHLYPLLLERGLTTTQVVAVMALIGPAQVGGRIAMTVLGRNVSIRRVGSLVAGAFPLALIGLAALPASFATAAGIIILYSIANGVLTIVRGAAVPEMLTKQNYGAVMGLMSIPATVARALAPLGAAALWSIHHTYATALIVIAAGACLLAASFWIAAVVSSRHPPSEPVAS